MDYKTRIIEMLEKISDEWVLAQIFRAVKNITA